MLRTTPLSALQELIFVSKQAVFKPPKAIRSVRLLAAGVDGYQLPSGCDRRCALYRTPQGRDSGVLAAV